MGGRLGTSTALLGVLCVALVAASGAHAASGEIRDASVDSEWERANLSGSVYRTTACLPVAPIPGKPLDPLLPGEPQRPEPQVSFSPCAWIPYATLGPSEVKCDAVSRIGMTVGDGVQLVWWGGEQIGTGSAHFDLVGISLEHGPNAPLLCLSVIEAARQPIVCVAVFPSPCPPYAIAGNPFQLDSALLETAPAVPKPPLASGPPTETAVTAPSVVPASEKPAKRRCRKATRRVTANAGRPRPSKPNRCGRRASTGHDSAGKN